MHKLKPLSETPPKPNFWLSSAVHSLITPSDLVEVSEVHTESQGAILLLRKENRCTAWQLGQLDESLAKHIVEEFMKERAYRIFIRLSSNVLSVTSECTALLSWKLGFGGVSDSGFSLCTAPTYYCGSEYFYNQHPQVWNLIGTEHSLNRSEHRVKSKTS